jgi:hypothetical protein
MHRHVVRVTYWTIALHIYHGFIHILYTINITWYIELARLTIHHYMYTSTHIAEYVVIRRRDSTQLSYGYTSIYHSSISHASFTYVSAIFISATSSITVLPE